MKIIDLRPGLVRRFTRTDKHPAKPGFRGRLAGLVSDAIINRKVASRQPPPKGALLVAVGNLALGGTGKTPVVMALAEGLAAAGIAGAVLTRGYGSSAAGPLVVHPDNENAGDEARMMALNLESCQWPVVQSRNRPEGLEFIRRMSPDLQVVLLEDAFQTARLARHVDLLILDSWEISGGGDSLQLSPVTGSIFPFGPWRETAAGARRASALLVEDRNLKVLKSSFGQPVFPFTRYVELRQVRGADCVDSSTRWALLSGIARPEKFENSARELLEGSLVLSVRCKDHARYGKALLKTIRREMDSTEAGALLTTAKDWVKLSSVWDDPRPVVVLDMKLQWAEKNALHQWLVKRVGELKNGQSDSTAP